jgi:excisionase family DNA binding protein
MSSERIQPPWRIKLHSVAEAADVLGISRSKVYELFETRKLAHHRIGGAIRVSAEQLAEYLETTKRERREEQP